MDSGQCTLGHGTAGNKLSDTDSASSKWSGQYYADRMVWLAGPPGAALTLGVTKCTSVKSTFKPMTCRRDDEGVDLKLSM